MLSTLLSLYSTFIFLKREQTLWAIKELDYYTFTHFSKPESNIIFTGLTTHPGFDTAKTLANFLVALINNYKIPITTADKTQTTWNRTGHSCVMAPELWNILPQHLLYMNAPASPHSKHKWKRISLPYSPHSPPLPAPLPAPCHLGSGASSLLSLCYCCGCLLCRLPWQLWGSAIVAVCKGRRYVNKTYYYCFIITMVSALNVG